MRVAIVGGTGFIGSYFVDALLAAGHTPRLLVRPGSAGKLREASRCETVDGEVSDAESLATLVKDCDVVSFNIGILREDKSRGITFDELQLQAAKRTLDASKAAGIRRFLLMSANGVRPDGTPYQQTKFAAEQAAQASGLDVTVFRPSVVFGDPRGLMEIGTQLHNDVVRLPIPAPGFISGFSTSSSTVTMSPVHVRDVTDTMLAALGDDDTIGKTLTLGGPEVLSWSTMIRRVAGAVGRNKWVLPAPVPLVRLPVSLLDWIPAFPVTTDQLDMLVDGNDASPETVSTLLGREPLAFDADNLDYLNSPMS
ncbi:MAG: NAD(P)H-binding protein [Pseudomonadota bacterium]